MNKPIGYPSSTWFQQTPLLLWFSTCLWQGLMHYSNIMLDAVHCHRYIWYTQHLESWPHSHFMITGSHCPNNFFFKINWWHHTGWNPDSRPVVCVLAQYSNGLTGEPYQQSYLKNIITNQSVTNDNQSAEEMSQSTYQTVVHKS